MVGIHSHARGNGVSRPLGDAARLLQVMGFAACLCACSSDKGSSNPSTNNTPNPDQHPDAGPVIPDLGEYGACTDQAPVDPAPDLTGVWAIRTVSSRYVPATSMTNPYYMRTVNILLSDQTQTGTNVHFNVQFCDQYAEDDGAPAHITVPESYVRSLQPFERDGTCAMGDAGAANVLWLPMHTQVVGATLADPVNDSLPTDPNDPTVFDQDQDGNPGITIKLSGVASGDLYVVQRQKDEMTGIAVTNDRVVGHYSFTSEQNVLASNPEWLKGLATQTAVTDGRPCASMFIMVRLAAGTTCAGVLANSTLFN